VRGDRGLSRRRTSMEWTGTTRSTVNRLTNLHSTSTIITHICHYPTAVRHHVLALFVCLQRYKNLEFSLSIILAVWVPWRFLSSPIRRSASRRPTRGLQHYLGSFKQHMEYFTSCKISSTRTCFLHSHRAFQELARVKVSCLHRSHTAHTDPYLIRQLI